MAGQDVNEDAFLTGEDVDEEKQLLSERVVRSKALIAHSKLRSWSLGILMCISLFLGMLSCRLELNKELRWPVYVDFIPLVFLPCFVYLAAVDFAATRISVNAALAKVVIVVVGFVVAVQLLLLGVFVCLKLTALLEWRWTSVLFPLWSMLLIMQLFFCYLIPGFIQMDRLQMCLAVFIMIWLVALSLLLISLKLDGELSGVHWCIVFIPLWVVMINQVVIAYPGRDLSEKLSVSEKNSLMDFASIVALFVGCIFLPFQLQGNIALPWGLIFTPPQVALALNCVQIWQGNGKQLDA